ncbi:MAG: enterochelin esterase [Gammaproteobacteria bacterium]|nr:enterochelin esterase [Gammaproteobacteria bacterium]
MNPQLRQLFRKGSPAPAALEVFIKETEFPLVDGSDVTFVYHGQADEVFLRCWIAGLDTAQPFQQLADSDLWATTIELPRGSRIEYKFEVVSNGHRELILDPLNDVLAHDPFGANSVCQGYGYERPDWTQHDPSVRSGSLEQLHFDSAVFGEQREAVIYLPARFRKNRRYPLLVVHDGNDYLNFAALQTVLDNLIQALEIPPLIAALIQSPDRLIEYSGNDMHADFVANELLTQLTDRYPLLDEPQSRCLMGASFGGVAALHTAWRNPGLFGRLLLQSGSFAFSDLGRHQRGPVFDPVVQFMNEFRKGPGPVANRIYLSCGIYESLIYENRSLVPRLQAEGIEVRFEEARDAHNWENWRDRLRTGLSWLFPGPLWLVYE